MASTEVVMTAIKTEDQSIMRLERLPKALVDYSKVHHVGGGPYKGILINKQASGLDEVVPEEARLEFLAYLSEQDGNSDPIQDYWVLKFWFQGTADGLKRKKIFTDYFQELMNPKNFPKNYIAFVKRALILLRRFEQIRRVDFVVQKSDDKSRDEELPPIKSFVTVYTPDSYTYQLVPEVQVNNKKFLAFKLKAGGDAHIALSAVYGDLDRKTHEIVIGAENNTKSMIRDGSLGIVKTEALTYSVLKAEEFRFFWISWADDHIEVGRGAHYGQGRFLSWKVPQYKRFNVNCLAVSTGRASRGQWEFAELLGQLPNLIVPQMRATESKQVYDQNPPVDDGTTRIFRTQSMMTIPSKAAGPRAVRRPVSHHDADSKAFEVDSNSSDSSRCESEQRDTRTEDLTPSRTEDLTPSRTEDLTPSRTEDLTPSRTDDLTPSRNEDLKPRSNEDAKVYTNVDTKLLGHEGANAFRNVGLEISRYEEKKPMRNEDTAPSSNEKKPWETEETKLWRYAEKKPVRNEDTELSSNEQKPKGNVETQLSRFENMEPSVKQNGPVSHKNSRIFRTQSSLVISNQRPVSHGFNGTVTHTKVLRRPWTGRQVITESWTNSRVVPDPSYRGYPVPPPNGLTKPKTWVATPAFQRPKNTSDLFESWRRRESGSLTKAELEDRQWVTNHVYDHRKKPVSVRAKSWESSTFLHHSVKDNQKQDSLWSNGTDVTDTVSEKWSDHTYSSGKPSSPASEAFDPKKWSSYHSLPRNHKCYCVTTNMNSEGNALYRSGYSLPGKVITSSYNYKPSMLGPSNADISLQGFKPPDEMSGGKPDVDFDKAAKAARKQKAKMSLIWLAKRQKLIQVLEDAYPNSVPITKLLEACKIKQTDMISAVVMLKDLEKRELIREIENGLWMRIPKGPKDSKSDIEMVDRMPILGRSDQPTIAIITALYCEKLAVDAMMEDKKTYVRYRTEGESQVYTLGRIGRHNVVSTKLSRLGSGRNAMISAENTTTRLLGTFGHVEHVILVGVGGAVPHFSDFSKHVRLGDVVISTPVDDSQTLYMQCTKVESMSGVSGYTYSTRSFSCMNQALQLVVQDLKRDFESGRVDKTFQSYIEDAKDSLDSEESSFHRPSIKSDQLFLVKPDGEKIRMEHPRPVGLQAKLYQEGQPFLRYGVIGAGRFVSRNDHMRREFAELNGIKAFDAEYDAVLHSLEGNRNDSLLVIRGMADYLDGSNKDWQPYAALVAAAYMKAVITALR